MVLYISCNNFSEALEFYRDTLGLEYTGKDEWSIVFETSNITLRINEFPDYEPLTTTRLGWIVDNIEEVTRKLIDKGINIERYDFFEHDDLGIITIADGSRFIYFKDPSGNIISLTEFSK